MMYFHNLKLVAILKSIFFILAFLCLIVCNSSCENEGEQNNSGPDKTCWSPEGMRPVGELIDGTCGVCICRNSGEWECLGDCPPFGDVMDDDVADSSSGDVDDDVPIDSHLPRDSSESDSEADTESDSEADTDLTDPEPESDTEQDPEMEPETLEEGDLIEEETTVSSCVDEDRDGFFVCTDPNDPNYPETPDCNDFLYFVQPGGYEFPNNEIDDDCDGEIDEEAESCSCALGANSSAEELLASIDTCNDRTASPIRSGNSRQFSVRSDYFTVEPKKGDCLAVLSTGEANAARGTSEYSSGVQEGTAFDFFFDGNPDPDPESDDPYGLVYDLAQLTFEIHPPPNAMGISFFFMFMSSEFPEYLCQTFNDTFYTIMESDVINGGQPTNVSFDRNGQEITVNVGYFELPSEWTIDLSASPFGLPAMSSCPGFAESGCELPTYCQSGENLNYIGSGSGWLLSTAPIQRGEDIIKITFSVHDEGDPILDSMVLIDDFRWLPYTPPIGTIKE